MAKAGTDSGDASVRVGANLSRKVVLGRAPVRSILAGKVPKVGGGLIDNGYLMSYQSMLA